MGARGTRRESLSWAARLLAALVVITVTVLTIVDEPSEGTPLASRPQPLGRPVSATLTPQTFYVSASGSDANAGTSPAKPWRTVGRVDQASLQAGDVVLFQGGATFSDARLEPPDSGAEGAPIVFGSYGQGQATITRGAWFVANHLVFRDLRFQSTFYGGSATHGSSNDVTLEDSTISLPSGNSSLGVFGNGQGWVIANNRIQNTGLSGLLLWGDGYWISGNTISETGLDTSVPYNAHGIYLDASNSTITGNTITDFQASGVSVRYRNSKIVDNLIAGGQIGIDFFQTDSQTGTSHWTDNEINGTTSAGIYVSPAGVHPTSENFIITGNTIDPRDGVVTNVARATRGRAIIRNQSR